MCSYGWSLVQPGSTQPPLRTSCVANKPSCWVGLNHTSNSSSRINPTISVSVSINFALQGANQFYHIHQVRTVSHGLCVCVRVDPN